MITVLMFLYIGSFIACLLSAMDKCPLWIAVVLMCIAGMLQVMPLGR